MGGGREWPVHRWSILLWWRWTCFPTIGEHMDSAHRQYACTWTVADLHDPVATALFLKKYRFPFRSFQRQSKTHKGMERSERLKESHCLYGDPNTRHASTCSPSPTSHWYLSKLCNALHHRDQPSQGFDSRMTLSRVRNRKVVSVSLRVHILAWVKRGPCKRVQLRAAYFAATVTSRSMLLTAIYFLHETLV